MTIIIAMYCRYLTAFGPTIDGRSVLPYDVRHMTTAPVDETGFGRVDLLLAIVDDESELRQSISEA